MQKNFDFESEIVISGMSGRFPDSANLEEFWQNLIDGKDMCTDQHGRFNVEEFDMPTRLGALKNVDKFDAEFFSVHGKQADVLDPRLRNLLEVAYEALVDAGINPETLKGTNTGVFVAGSDSEAGFIWKRCSTKPNSYGVLGNVLSMMSNRLSFTFGLTGPSYVVDTACSGSSVALQQALHSIRTGLCDAAIVAGVQTHHDPISSYMFYHLEMTSRDGKSKVFDASADGYVRSEAAVALYLCKKQVAKRSYASVVHAATNNDGYKEQGITFPAEAQQEEVIRRVYDECGVSPLEVDYIEAHGTGTKVGDPEEMAAVTKVFCEGRKGPLLVGSVKSNMGHPETVAGLCAISKVLLSNTHGIIPANLHYNTPNPDIPALIDGRIVVVDKNQPFNAKYVGVSSMGFGGTNVHILLKMTPRDEPKLWTPTVPVMILTSGRTEEAVQIFLEKALANHQNHHYVSLLHEVSKHETVKHPFRGFVVVDPEKTEIQVEQRDSNRSNWYIFTGLGSQWAGMSKDLIKFEAFKNSVSKSANALKVHNNFDIISLLECGDPKKFEDFKNSVVSITTIQIALIDLLASIGIKPDGIIGHSTGEVAAAYADGCLTQEQAVLVSFARVRAVLESNLPPGTVASVGLTWEEAQKRIPPGAYCAIHNSKENVTIAGPPDVIKSFLAQLESEGVFAKPVRSAAYGFHSPLVEESGKLAKVLLEKIIPNPKPRSKIWLSSSVPEERWDTDLAKYCSADYYVNNGVKPVYFYPTLKHVPENAIIFEIAPHCFFQSILKQSLPKNVVKLGMIHCKSKDNCVFFLQSIGQCFIAGVNVDISSLYEPVSYPAPPPTPNISSLIRWDHSTTWDIPHHKNELSRQKGTKYSIHLLMDTDAFLEGHKIDEKIVFPATGYLHLIWKFFAHQQGTNSDKLPVVFEDVSFQRLTLLNKRTQTEFLLNIFQGSGRFEILESDMTVCTGLIRNVEGALEDEMFIYEDVHKINESGPSMNKDDFYKEMELRGYCYTGQFQGIQKLDMKGRWSNVQWQGHWISFMDSLLQTFSLRNNNRDLVVPTHFEKVTIDPNQVREYLDNHENMITVKSWDDHGTGTCPGVELRGFRFVKFNQRLRQVKPTIMEETWLPYIDESILSEKNALDYCTELILDNSCVQKFVFTEILQKAESMISHLIIDQCMTIMGTQFEFRLVNESEEALDEESIHKSAPAILSLQDAKAKASNYVYIDDARRLAEAKEMVAPGGYLLYSGVAKPDIESNSIILIAQKSFKKEDAPYYYFLYRKLPAAASKISVISLDEPNYEWVEKAKKATEKENLAAVERLIFVSQSASSGILGFVKCIVKEVTSEKIRCFQTLEPIPLNFEKPSEELRKQLEKDLIFNVYKSGRWGFFSNFHISNEAYEEHRLATHVFANATTMGDLSSLTWIESPLRLVKEELVEVHYASLNFKDIMLAGGKLVQEAEPDSPSQSECVLGFEFSGMFQGRRVCGLGSSQCLATRIDPKNVIMFDIPKNWSLEEAATSPSVYATVYFSLIVRGKLKEGETILIHAGSGGVGQAAIEVALRHKCRVFTTVSTPEKREFLKGRFPSLTEDSFTNSRDAKEFEGHVKKHTQGKGVDMVLNSLAQDKLLASIRCLGQNGRFLEIGKYDMFMNTKIGLNILAKGVSIHGILLDKLLDEGPSEELNTLKNLVEKGMISGDIKPIPATLFGADQLEEAFRYMAQGKHIGKVVIKVKDEEASKALPALPRTYFDSKKSYVIIGGLGGMGFELANWMIDRQVRKVVLVSRSGKTSTYHDMHIEIWKQRGVSVLLNQSDVSTSAGAKSLLLAARELGPIGGIFNTAVVLKDAPLENQTSETFIESAKCKVDATIHLDTLSRQLAPELDYFVVFSSLVAAKGNASQTNYGYANSVMERICEQRKAEGLPALAMQWGVVGDVGVLNRAMKEKRSFFGLAPQSLKSCLQTLDLGLQQSRPIVASFVPINSGDMAKINPNESLVNIAATILGIKDISKVNPKTKLVDLGMDSLMAAELAQVLQTRRSIQMSNKEYAQLTFERLAEIDKNEASKEETEVTKENQTELKKMLAVKALSDKAVFKMKSLSKTADTIFIVHPMDGTMMMLEELVGELESNVYGVECVKEAPLESLEGLAAFYLQKIREIQPRGPYKLGGYSFGGNVAFEMTLMLEKENEKVSLLLLLDGSPRWKHINENFVEGKTKRSDWENMVLIGYMKNYITDVPFTAFRDLSEMTNQAEKVSYVARLLHEYYPDVALEEIKDCASYFKKRVECGMGYEPKDKAKARTVLLKATLGGLDKQVAEDYGLSEVCESSVEIIEIPDNHFCFYENPFDHDLPAIINDVIAKNV